MNFLQWALSFFLLMLTVSLNSYAGSLLPTNTTHGNWIFSGVVHNECGENYGYFFQMHRSGNTFHSIAAIVDAQSKQVLLYDESSAVIKYPEQPKWQVGRAFFTFNPINESWVFGLRLKNKKGFNFKVDMLTQTGKSPVPQDLRHGIELLVNQTGRINGHLNLGSDRKEEFVTADNAWFRQVWLTEKQSMHHPFSSLLCRFSDGGGFYSVNMKEEDAQQGAVVGLCNAQSKPSVMSQFIDVQENTDGAWHIHIPSPAMNIELNDAIKQETVLAGFILKGAKNGFCMLSKNKFDEGLQQKA